MRAGAAPYRARPVSDIDGIDIHYTASLPSTTVEAIARFQTGATSQEEFPAIAYTFVVTEDGAIHRCHGLGVRCWHNGAPGHNTTRIGVCYTGHYEPNQAQIEGMRWLVTHLEQELERSLVVEGHRSHYATACPGPTMETWLPMLR